MIYVGGMEGNGEGEREEEGLERVGEGPAAEDQQWPTRPQQNQSSPHSLFPLLFLYFSYFIIQLLFSIIYYKIFINIVPEDNWFVIINKLKSINKDKKNTHKRVEYNNISALIIPIVNIWILNININTWLIPIWKIDFEIESAVLSKYNGIPVNTALKNGGYFIKQMKSIIETKSKIDNKNRNKTNKQSKNTIENKI